MAQRPITATQRELELLLNSHEKEHILAKESHEKVHEMESLALIKAEIQMSHRLESMNEFREQLNSQAATFLTRDAIESSLEEWGLKLETASSTYSEKTETVFKALVSRHDSDYDTLRELIQGEREARKQFEGSINTWKWIASFLGASGVVGVFLLFVNNAT